jgi:tRNA A37 methylthiotransferase MiaB
VANGHTITQEPKECDYIIVNSCGVTDRGKNRTLNLVRKYIDLKDNHTSIILFGCLIDIDRQVTQNLDVLCIGLQDCQRLDTIFYQNKRFEDTEPHCDNALREELIKGKHRISIKPTDDPIKIALIDLYPYFLSFPLIQFFPSARNKYHRIRNRYSNNINVEISKGCTGNCNYCLVKKAKGTVQSRNIQDILKDIEKLYDPSKELYLVGDDCGCYGVDKGLTIIDLIDAIHDKFPDLRLKINYIDPSYLIQHSGDFLRIFRTTNISDTLIPLQSGSQKVLAKMNRKYDVTKVIDVIQSIRHGSPETIITSHFIVGHPGETWNDFCKTLAVCRFFDYPEPFVYSNNKDTASSRMTEQVPHPIGLLRYIIFIVYLNIVMVFRMTDAIKRNNNI